MFKEVPQIVSGDLWGPWYFARNRPGYHEGDALILEVSNDQGQRTTSSLTKTAKIAGDNKCCTSKGSFEIVLELVVIFRYETLPLRVVTDLRNSCNGGPLASGVDSLGSGLTRVKFRFSLWAQITVMPASILQELRWNKRTCSIARRCL